jgi:hypothetical protein
MVGFVEEIIKGLYVGSDKDVEKAEERGYARLACCKDGPDSHRSMLKYTTPGAPKGKDYLFVRDGNVLALNLIDVDDPTMIPDEVIDLGIEFIAEMQTAGRKLLVHCNAGYSRSTTITLMYLRAVGEMPDSFITAEKKFRYLYPPYDPGVGMRAHARERWKSLPDFFKGQQHANTA